MKSNALKYLIFKWDQIPQKISRNWYFDIAFQILNHKEYFRYFEAVASSNSQLWKKHKSGTFCKTLHRWLQKLQLWRITYNTYTIIMGFPQSEISHFVTFTTSLTPCSMHVHIPVYQSSQSHTHIVHFLQDANGWTPQSSQQCPVLS